MFKPQTQSPGGPHRPGGARFLRESSAFSAFSASKICSLSSRSARSAESAQSAKSVSSVEGRPTGEKIPEFRDEPTKKHGNPAPGNAGAVHVRQIVVAVLRVLGVLRVEGLQIVPLDPLWWIGCYEISDPADSPEPATHAARKEKCSGGKDLLEVELRKLGRVAGPVRLHH